MSEHKFYSIDYKVKSSQIVVQGTSIHYKVAVQMPNEYEKETKVYIDFNYFETILKVNFPKMPEKFMIKLQKHIEKAIEKFVKNQIQEGFTYPSPY